MALTDKIKGRRVFIAIGDGATPETFSPMCGLSEKNFQQTRATNDQVDYDCADPDAAPVIVRTGGARDWSMAGNGLLDRSVVPIAQAAYENNNPTNFRWVYDEETGDEVINGYYEGPGFITDFAQNGNNDGFVNVSITITAAGPASFVPLS